MDVFLLFVDMADGNITYKVEGMELHNGQHLQGGVKLEYSRGNEVNHILQQSHTSAQPYMLLDIDHLVFGEKYTLERLQ